MPNLYKKYTKSDIKNKDGGYKNRILFAPVDTFIVNALPAPGATPLLGDTKKITTSHTFGGSDGFIEIFGKIDSATSKFTTDDDGVFTHTFEIDIEGDSPELYEQLEGMVGDSVSGSGAVILLKDGNCIDATSYNQWGDSCLQPKLKVDFDAKTTASGTKIQKLSGTIRGHRYWYYGTIQEKTYVVSLSCPIITASSTATSITVSWSSVSGATNYDVKLFSDSAGTVQVGATQNTTGTGPISFTGLTASTQYYIRVIPKNATTSTTNCGLVGEKTPAV